MDKKGSAGHPQFGFAIRGQWLFLFCIFQFPFFLNHFFAADRQNEVNQHCSITVALSTLLGYQRAEADTPAGDCQIVLLRYNQ